MIFFLVISIIFTIFVAVNQRFNIEKYLEEFRTSMARMEGTVAELTDKFGDNALENMVLTTDRHTAYFTLKVKGHQICIAHLLRNLNYLNELDKDQS